MELPVLSRRLPPARTLALGLPGSTLAMVVLLLASIDGFATILVLRREVGIEVNPLMRWLLGHGELPFLLIKLLLTALCARWIARHAGHPYGRLAAVVALAIYLPITGLHIFNNWAPRLLF